MQGDYFPAVASYKNAKVRLNFGPKFRFPPKGYKYKPMSARAEQVRNLYKGGFTSIFLFRISSLGGDRAEHGGHAVLHGEGGSPQPQQLRQLAVNFRIPITASILFFSIVPMFFFKNNFLTYLRLVELGAPVYRPINCQKHKRVARFLRDLEALKINARQFETFFLCLLVRPRGGRKRRDEMCQSRGACLSVWVEGRGEKGVDSLAKASVGGIVSDLSPQSEATT